MNQSEIIKTMETRKADTPKLRRLRRQVIRMRTIKEILLDHTVGLTKNKGGDDDDTDAMTEPTLSEITSFDLSEASSIELSASQEAQFSFSCSPQRVKGPRFAVFGGANSCKSPQGCGETRPLHDSHHLVVDVEEEIAQGLEGPNAADRYVEDLNDWFTGCFNCTHAYAPPVTSKFRYKHVSAPGNQRSVLQEDGFFNQDPLAIFPYGSRSE